MLPHPRVAFGAFGFYYGKGFAISTPEHIIYKAVSIGIPIALRHALYGILRHIKTIRIPACFPQQGIDVYFAGKVFVGVNRWGNKGFVLLLDGLDAFQLGFQFSELGLRLVEVAF